MSERTTAELIREEMERRSLGVRGLARLLAESGDHTVEQWRRNLHRYLAGSNPKPEQATLMESRLGLPAGSLHRHEPRTPRATDLEDRLAAIEGAIANVLQALEANDQRLELLEQRISAAAR